MNPGTGRRILLLALAAAVVAALGVGSYLLGIRLSSGAPAAATAPTGAAFSPGTRLDNAPYVGDVALEQAGRGPVTLADFEGRYLVLYFGYTNCPDVCPVTLAKLADIVRGLDDPDEVLVAMITVDPETDTADVLARYVSAFHPDFIGLGGGQGLVADALKTFYIAARKTAPDSPLVIHSEAILLIDPEGLWRMVYGQGSMEAVGADLERVVKGGGEL